MYINYHLPTTARHFAQEKNNHISDSLCNYVLVNSYYRYSQLFRHTSLLTLAGERAAQVLLTISPGFEKIRSQGTVVADVPR